MGLTLTENLNKTKSSFYVAGDKMQQAVRFIDLEKKLGNLVREVCEDKLDLSCLYDKAEEIKYEAIKRDPGAWDNDISNLLLKDALDNLHLLHDAGTREYYKEHKEELGDYAKRLLGEKESNFKVKLPDEIELNIVYKQTA